MFGPLPTCVWGAQADLALATNYQDLWWNAGGRVGLGRQLHAPGRHHLRDLVHLRRRRQAVVADRRAAQDAGGRVRGRRCRRSTGPAFNAVPFDTTKVVETVVGTATVTFADGNRATFAYTVNGTTQTKAITRQVFVAPGTVCSSAAAAAHHRRCVAPAEPGDLRRVAGRGRARDNAGHRRAGSTTSSPSRSPAIRTANYNRIQLNADGRLRDAATPRRHQLPGDRAAVHLLARPPDARRACSATSSPTRSARPTSCASAWPGRCRRSSSISTTEADLVGGVRDGALPEHPVRGGVRQLRDACCSR